MKYFIMNYVKADITGKFLITPYLGIFRFKQEQPISFLPGQYKTLGIRRRGLEGRGVKVENGIGTVWRPYSIASSPEEEVSELYVAWVQQDGRRLDEWGVLSTELFNPAHDAEYLFRNKAKGKFLLPQDDRDVVMVATGTGIAPFISILRYQNNQNDKRKFFLIHGVSHRSDLAYGDELLNGYNLKLNYLKTTSREDYGEYNKKYAEEFFINRDKSNSRLSSQEIDEAIQSGTIHNTTIEKIVNAKFDPRYVVIMLCGNPDMISNIKKIASTLGFKDRQDIISEEYW